MATYYVDNAYDFLAKLEAWNAEVICQEDAVFDFTNFGTCRIPINCAVVRGNGAIIRNLTVDQIVTSAASVTPTTEINDLKIESANFTPNHMYVAKNGIFSLREQTTGYSPTINFNNCIISAYFDDYTGYVCMTSKYSQEQAKWRMHINFYACSLHVNVERSDFEISKYGKYVDENREALITFECCKLNFNAPLVERGSKAVDCFHHKTEVYYYMPRWNGWATHDSSGYHAENVLSGDLYKSCVIRGNLTSLNGAQGMNGLDGATTPNITVLCANLGENYFDMSGGFQLRILTEAEARDKDKLLMITFVTHGHFDLVVDDPTPTDWQLDPNVNDGLPFIQVMPEIIRIYPIIRKTEKIRIYDMHSTQTALQTNGLAMLDAIEATIKEVINGEYSLTFSHPIDEKGKWKYIKESNIVKCRGQYFTIVSCVWDYSSNKTGVINARCEHVFYQCNDKWIYPENVPLYDLYSCKSAMDAIMGAAIDYDDSQMHRFLYEWASDWSWTSPFLLSGFEEGCTPINAMLSGTGIIGVKGGELYRDNFYFSINERMENANDNAFDIRFSNNAASIKRTVDTSNMCTFLKVYDTRTGSWVAISYTNAQYPLFQFPHTIARSRSFTFSEQVYEAIENEEISIFDMLFPLMGQIWKSTCTPVLCYEVEISDYTEKYAEGISVTQDYRVGDSGRIHDKLLGVDVMIRITETEKDGLTGRTKKVVFGSKNSFTRSSGYPKPFQGEAIPIVEGAEQLKDKMRLKLFDRSGKKIMRKVVV